MSWTESPSGHAKIVSLDAMPVVAKKDPKDGNAECMSWRFGRVQIAWQDKLRQRNGPKKKMDLCQESDARKKTEKMKLKRRCAPLLLVQLLLL